MKVRTHAVRLSEPSLLDSVWVLGPVASVRVADQWFASAWQSGSGLACADLQKQKQKEALTVVYTY
jgi:hypothetical protein